MLGAVPAEPFTGERRARAVAQQPFQAGAISGLDAYRSVHGKAAAVVPAGEVVGNLGGQCSMAHGGAQHAGTDLALHGLHRPIVEIRGMKTQRAMRIGRKHAIGEAQMQVSVGVERRTEPLHERDAPAAGGTRRAGAAAAQSGLDRS